MLSYAGVTLLDPTAELVREIEGWIDRMEVREMQDHTEAHVDVAAGQQHAGASPDEGGSGQGAGGVPTVRAQADHLGAVSVGKLVADADREAYRRVGEKVAMNPEKYKGWVWA